MFGKEITKREMLLGGVIVGMFIERGVNKLLTWRTEAARARLIAANPDLAKCVLDNIQTNIRNNAKAFHAEPRN